MAILTNKTVDLLSVDEEENNRLFGPLPEEVARKKKDEEELNVYRQMETDRLENERLFGPLEPMTQNDFATQPLSINKRLEDFTEGQERQTGQVKEMFGVSDKTKDELENERLFGPVADPSFGAKDILGGSQSFVQAGVQSFGNIAETAMGQSKNPNFNNIDIPFTDKNIDLNYLMPGKYITMFNDLMLDKGNQAAQALGIVDEKTDAPTTRSLLNLDEVKNLPTPQFEIDHPTLGGFTKVAGEFLPEMMMAQSGAAKTVGGILTKGLAQWMPEGSKIIGRTAASATGALLAGLSKGDPELALENVVMFPMYELGMRGAFKVAGKTIAAPFKGAKWGIDKATGGKLSAWMKEQRHSLGFIDDLISKNIDTVHDGATYKTKLLGKAQTFKEWKTLMKKKGIDIKKMSMKELDAIDQYYYDHVRLIEDLQRAYPKTKTGTIRKLINNLEKRNATLDNKKLMNNIEPLITERNKILDGIERDYLLHGLHDVGVKPSNFTSLAKYKRIFYNTIERVSKVDEKLNIGATETVMDLIHGNNVRQNIRNGMIKSFDVPIKALTKMRESGIGKGKKISRDRITHLLKYIEMGKDGKPFWNPNLSREAGYSAFDGAKPTQEVLEHLFGMRTQLDDIYKANPDLFKNVGYVPRYIPRANKYSLPKIGADLQDPILRITEPRIGHSRSADKAFASKGMEENISTLLQSYANQVSNYQGFKDVIPKLQKTIFRMQALGLDPEANNLKDAASKAMGLVDASDLRRVSAGEFANASVPEVEKMMKAMGLKPGAIEDILRTAHKLMYEAFIGMNPKTILYKQPHQPLWVGAGETGVEYVLRAEKALVTGEYKALLKQMGPYLRAEELDVLETGMREASRKGIKVTGDILGFFGKGGMKLFTGIDKINRQTSFLSGYIKMGDAITLGGTDYKNLSPQILEAIEHLLPGEKVMVVKTLRTKGGESAKKLFGTIISNRVNYDYGLINKPQWLRSDLGRLIPFTTWGRNQFMRVVGDVQNKNGKQLAKRIAVPLAYAMLLKMITGYDTTNDMPVMSMGASLPGTIAPQFNQSVHKLTSQGGLAAATDLGKAIPLSKALFDLKRTDKIAGKKGSGAGIAEGIFHLRKDGWITDLMKLMGMDEQ